MIAKIAYLADLFYISVISTAYGKKHRLQPSSHVKGKDMSQPQPWSSILNALLSDSALTQDLSTDECEAVKSFVEELIDGVSQFTEISPSDITEPSSANRVDIDRSAATDIDALISELGIELEDTAPKNGLVNNSLDEQSDATLIDWLGDHVDAASSVVEVLGNRSIGRQELNTIRRVELQLVGVSLYVSDLRQALERQVDGKRPVVARCHWRNHLKSLLLREFHLINNWVK